MGYYVVHVLLYIGTNSQLPSYDLALVCGMTVSIKVHAVTSIFFV